jgi:hypothetical protein
MMKDLLLNPLVAICDFETVEFKLSLQINTLHEGWQWKAHSKASDSGTYEDLKRIADLDATT